MRHGYAQRGKKTPEYRAWTHMRGRCFTPTDTRYADYGGRGITVCERWNSFENFLEDMGLKPSPKHSLDRIDNDGNYTPENCRWATQTEQNYNRRLFKNNRSGVKGVFLTAKGWRARVYKAGQDIHLGYYKTLEEAAKVQQLAERTS